MEPYLSQLFEVDLSSCRRMGRDVTGLRIDKKSIMVNDKSNGSPNRAVHVAPKALPENSETNEEQDAVLGVESINDEPDEKIIKSEVKKSTDKQISLPAKPESGSAGNGTAEKQASCSSHANGVDDDDSGERVLSKSHYLDSPKSTKKSEVSAVILDVKLSCIFIYPLTSHTLIYYHIYPTHSFMGHALIKSSGLDCMGGYLIS